MSHQFLDDLNNLLSCGIAAGIPAVDIEDWTQLEINNQINSYNLKMNSVYQNLSVIAAIAAKLVMSDSKIFVPELFPYWSDGELQQLKIQHYKNMLKNMNAQNKI